MRGKAASARPGVWRPLSAYHALMSFIRSAADHQGLLPGSCAFVEGIALKAKKLDVGAKVLQLIVFQMCEANEAGMFLVLHVRQTRPFGHNIIK